MIFTDWLLSKLLSIWNAMITSKDSDTLQVQVEVFNSSILLLVSAIEKSKYIHFIAMFIVPSSLQVIKANKDFIDGIQRFIEHV